MTQPLKYTKNLKDIFQSQAEKKKTYLFQGSHKYREEDKNRTVFVP